MCAQIGAVDLCLSDASRLEHACIKTVFYTSVVDGWKVAMSTGVNEPHSPPIACPRTKTLTLYVTSPRPENMAGTTDQTRQLPAPGEAKRAPLGMSPKCLTPRVGRAVSSRGRLVPSALALCVLVLPHAGRTWRVMPVLRNLEICVPCATEDVKVDS